MSKKGFTLVEIIAVIVILSLILVIVVPLVNSSSNNAKIKTYQTKLDMIEDAAVLYGQDNYRKIIDSANKGLDGYSTESKDTVTYRIQTIFIKDLVPEYVKADTESTTNMILDPRDNSKFLDEYKIEIKINPNNRKVTAEVIDR